MTQVQISRSSVPGARPTVGSQPTGSLYVNFADQKLGYIDPTGTPIDLPTGGDAPVTSVNTKVGDVVLTAADVGAADATHTHPLLSADADNYSRLGADGLIYTPTPAATTAPVTSVNAKTGDVVLTAADVGAAPAAHNHVISDVTGLQPALDSKVPTATNGDWVTKGVGSYVVGELGWKAFGNGHSIIDASGGTAPTGAAIDTTNSASAWSGGYPNLMGWNGSSTYGLRVDSARQSDYCTNAVAKWGDTMSGDLQIQKTLPKLSLHYPGSLLWDFYINTGDGGVQNSSGRWIWYSNNLDFFVPGNLVSYWSDARLKEAVRDLDGYEERIMGLRPVSFAWNKKGRELTNRKYREREIGFIAQEAQSVSDQYVAENPVAKSDEGDAYLTVQKDEMIADLVAMVQQLNRRIAKLEGA
jgi:hypothetical protein